VILAVPKEYWLICAVGGTCSALWRNDCDA
jgi:hypothetical protein